jgi:hypothetical protein
MLAGGLFVSLALFGCQRAEPQAVKSSGVSHLAVSQMAPPPPPNADPQQKAMQELAQQKAREAMQKAMQPR